MRKLTRRVFLKLSGSTAAGALLTTTGCAAPQAAQTEPVQQTEPTQPDVQQPVPSSTPTTAPATPTPAPATATPTQPPSKTYRRPEVIQVFPATGKSQVVRARSAKAWEGEKVSPAILRQMVDGSLTQLTGLSNVKEAWLALFDPSENIAIKVNAFRNSTIWTHPELVKAVTDSMQEAGIPGEQITIFDFYTSELETAGFAINRDGPGVRCYGTDESYSTSWDVAGRSFRVSDILANCDALINMPVLKSHMMAGLTFALKNHYGSVSYPDGLHNIETSLPALNALALIKDSTRLVIGDALHANTKWSYSFPYWVTDAIGDSILMSFDPLAHDRVGLDMLVKMAEEKGSPTKSILGMAEPWFKTSAEAKLGAADLAQIDLKEIDID